MSCAGSAPVKVHMRCKNKCVIFFHIAKIDSCHCNVKKHNSNASVFEGSVTRQAYAINNVQQDTLHLQTTKEMSTCFTRQRHILNGHRPVPVHNRII